MGILKCLAACFRGQPEDAAADANSVGSGGPRSRSGSLSGAVTVRNAPPNPVIAQMYDAHKQNLKEGKVAEHGLEALEASLSLPGALVGSLSPTIVRKSPSINTLDRYQTIEQNLKLGLPIGSLPSVDEPISTGLDEIDGSKLVRPVDSLGRPLGGPTVIKTVREIGSTKSEGTVLGAGRRPRHGERVDPKSNFRLGVETKIDPYAPVNTELTASSLGLTG